MKISLDPVGSLWRSAWRLYADRFAVVTEIILPPVLLLGLGNILKVFIGSPIVIAGSVLLAAGVLLSIVAGAAILYSFHHATGFEESYRAVGGLFWQLVWIAILVGIASIGGFVMLVIPGIWLAVSMAFSNYALVLEGKRGFAAMVQSREYIRGYWWAIFGRMALLVCVFIVTYVVVGVPFALVGGGAIGSAIASAIITLFIAPFSIAYYYTIYRNLVTLKSDIHSEPSSGWKTFIVVAQIVGAICILVAIAGMAFR